MKNSAESQRKGNQSLLTKHLHSQANCSYNCAHPHAHSWIAIQVNNLIIIISLNVGFSWHSVFISVLYINILCKEKLLNCLLGIPLIFFFFFNGFHLRHPLLTPQVHRGWGKHTVACWLFFSSLNWPDTKPYPCTELLARKLFWFLLLLLFLLCSICFCPDFCVKK